jgi:hypothetical protein
LAQSNDDGGANFRIPITQSVVRGELEISNKDGFMLASLWLQATRGDYDEARDTPEVRQACSSFVSANPHLAPFGQVIAKIPLIPEANKEDILRSSQLQVTNTRCGD